MSSSPPETRPATVADADAVAELLQAHELEILGRAVTSAAKLPAWWVFTDLPTGSWLVERDGRLDGAAWLLRSDACHACVAARPGHRELEADLLDLAEDRVRELGGDQLRVSVLAADERGAAHVEGRGYRPVRRFYEMRLDFDGPPPEPVWPDGIRVAGFRAQDARAFHDAADDAFAGEWGFNPLPFDEWRALRVDGVDTSLYFIAWEGDEIAGYLRAEVQLSGFGYIGMIGVRPGWRGRGIGEALLRHAFGEFHRRGMSGAALDVDSENPAGATRLYERVGMRVASEDVVYERELV